MSPKRIDAVDSIDTVTHFLHRLQASGWVLDTLVTRHEYFELKEGSPKIPERTIISIELIPGRS